MGWGPYRFPAGQLPLQSMLNPWRDGYHAGMNDSSILARMLVARANSGVAVSEVFGPVTWTEEEYEEWSGANFTRAESARWKRFGFTATEASAWYNAGCTSSTRAASLVDVGGTPEMCVTIAVIHPLHQSNIIRCYSLIKRHGMTPDLAALWCGYQQIPLKLVPSLSERGLEPEVVSELMAHGISDEEGIAAAAALMAEGAPVEWILSYNDSQARLGRLNAA